MKTKKKVVLVDDDLYFVQSSREWLEDEGINVITATKLSEAKEILNVHSDIDAVICDIMMPPDGESDYETRMGYRSGLIFARWVKQHYPSITLIGISGVKSLDVIEWFKKHSAYFLEKGASDFVDELNRILGKEDRLQCLKTFIVHGHDDVTKYELKNYLQNTLKLPEPIILHEQPSLGRTIIEKFEDTVRQVDLVFVLLTPDDAIYESSESDELKRRARQNVIFELGFFLGKLQRRKGKIILLYKGQLELPSDIVGIIYVDISQGIDSASDLIRKEVFSNI